MVSSPPIDRHRSSLPPPAVSIVVPCRNERDHIVGCIQSLLAQDLPDGGLEVIVADGLSTDGTRELLGEFAKNHPALRVIDNPRGIVSTALNEAIATARGGIIIRADVHTQYAHDYVRECVRVLQETGADNVGGPWQASGSGYISDAIAAAFHSRFGSGGARAHDRAYEGMVDTVYLGCWRRELFDRVGLFDEELVRNQDDEFNLRLTRGGAVVWQSPRIKSRYHPRGSLRRLFQQYMQYGYWKVRVIQKHRLAASWRHVAPGAFVFALLALLVASAISDVAVAGFLALSGTYLVCAVVASAVTAVSAGGRLLPVLPVVFFCFHIGYGFGFLCGVLDFVILRRPPTDRMVTITRS